MTTLLIVGASGGTHVGDSFVRAATQLEIPARLLDVNRAYGAPRLVRSLNWHLRGHRPARLLAFGREVLQAADELRPELVLSTGIAPIPREALEVLKSTGVKLVNFLTDDPWNTAHKAKWFMDCLPAYDIVFTPRRANIPDLHARGCTRVNYLPFAYDPDLCFSPSPADAAEFAQHNCDVVFVGGADWDRVPYMRALLDAGHRLALYGSFWDRYPETRSAARGPADLKTLRLAIAASKVALCLVRRQNRDGNCMRSFEVPAIGGCMLADDTDEHREIFGPEGEAVLYFKLIPEMLEKVRLLCGDSALRTRLAASALRLVTTGGHTYAHRLQSMLQTSGVRS